MKVNIINKFTGTTKTLNVPHAIADAVTVSGMSAVLGVVTGFIFGGVRDIHKLLKKK